MAEGGSTVTPTMTAEWQTPALDAAAVHHELDRLWGKLSSERPRGGEQVEAAPNEAILTRASTLNLIAVAATRPDATRIEATIGKLTEFCPSRAVILVTGESGPADGLDVRVAVHEQPAGKGRPAVRFETVTVGAGVKREESLASVASPLLVPELPDFLWWPGGAFAGSPLFQELVEVCDRLIVDTATLPNPGDGLRALADLSRHSKFAPQLGDFAWNRLSPWRQMIAQFFDAPAAQPCLECIDEVGIVVGVDDGEGRSGLSAGLLMAGWLATRLGWQAPGELVRSRDGWRLTLRAGRPGHRREVILTLWQIDDPHAAECLGAVSLIATGTAPGTFMVERADQQGVTTTSEIATMPRVSRMVYSRPPDDTALLGEELRMFTRDRVFEEALVFAAGLMPPAEEE